MRIRGPVRAADEFTVGTHVRVCIATVGLTDSYVMDRGRVCGLNEGEW
jgi:hypothetical protein